jgi:SPP1 gp7 family putative phage head morphogenesis protein
MWRAHEVDGRIAAKNAVKIRAALRQSVNGRAIFEAYAYTQPNVTDNPTQDRARARAWALMNVRINNESLRKTLLRLYAEAWVTGDLAARAALVDMRKGEKALTKADDIDANISTIDWDSWQPGDAASAMLLDPPKAFQNLVERSGNLITGLDKTGYELIGTTLADAIRTGTPPGKAAKLIENAVGSPARALTIAVTENSRVMNAAAIQRYKDAGIQQVKWMAVTAVGGAPCDKCASNIGQVVEIGASFNSGQMQPPAHPHCRCNLLPEIPDYESYLNSLGYEVNPTGGSITTPSVGVDADSIFPDRELDDLRGEVARIEKEIREMGYTPYGVRDGYSPEAHALRDRADELEAQWQAKRKKWYDEHFTVNGKGTGTDTWIVQENPARDTYVVYDKATLSMNKSLRQGKPPSERALKIDDMVAEGKAVSDTTVFRSSVLPEKLHEVLEEGYEYTDLGFQSTSVARSGTGSAEFYAKVRVENGAKGDIVMMNIKIPAGATARDVGVGEVVLPRGTKMRVVRRTKRADGVIEIDMEVIL